MALQNKRKPLLTDLFVEKVKSHPYNLAVNYDDGVIINSLAYHEVYSLAEKLIKFFQSENAQNEAIGFLGEANLLYPSVFIGILLIPGIFVIIDKELSRNEIREFMNRLNIRYLLTDNLSYKKYDVCNWSNCKEVYQLQYLQWIIYITKFDATLEKCNNDLEIAYIISTSGTTGTPKIVRVPHSCILPNINDFRQTFNILETDIIFMASPVTFDPSIVDLFLALSSGAMLLIVPDKIKIVPNELINVLFQRHKVTVLQATPSLMKRFGAESLQNSLLSSSTCLRILALGGESCPSLSLLKLWRASNNKTRIFNIYGVTEVSSWATIYEITEEDFMDSSELVPLGRSLEDTIIEVKDENGIILKAGEGQLFIGGQRRCFIDNEHLEEIKEDFQRETGDWVKINDSGKIYFKGRKDDRIKRNGKNIYLSRIDKVCQALEYIKDCCTVYDNSNNSLALYIVISDVSKKEDIMTNTTRCLSNILPAYAVPDSVIIVHTLPVTSHGKVNKRKLLEMLPSHQNRRNRSFKNISKVALKAEWQKYFREMPVSDEDNFLHCGGNSIQIVQFSQEIEMSSGCEMPLLVDMLMNSTFENVWIYINKVITSNSGYIQNYISENQETSGNVIDHKQSSSHHTVTVNTPKRSCSENDSDLMPRNLKSIKLLNEESGDFNNLKHVLFLSRGRFFGNFDNFSAKDLNIKNEKDILNNHKNHILNIEILWKYNMEKCIDASPLLVIQCCKTEDAFIYVGSHSHKFAAISSESGKELWSTKLGDRIESSACASYCGKFIYVGCYDFCLYCISAKNGEIKWKFKTNGEIKSSPIVDTLTDSVIVGSHDQHLYCLNVKNGKCLWKIRPSNGSIFSSPYIERMHSPYVYVGTLDGIFCAVSPVNGSLMWKLDFKKPLFSSPITTRKGVCIGSVDGHLFCYTHDGQKVWHYKTEGPIFSSPCLYNKSTNQEDFLIFIGSYDNHLYCIEFTNGKLLWKFATVSSIYGVPFCTFISLKSPCTEKLEQSTSKFFDKTGDGNLSKTMLNIVVFATINGTIYVVDAGNGTCLCTFQMRNEIFSSPVVWRNSIFIGCRDNLIYKLKICDNSSYMQDEISLPND